MLLFLKYLMADFEKQDFQVCKFIHIYVVEHTHSEYAFLCLICK